jgi:hypothetical protein
MAGADKECGGEWRYAWCIIARMDGVRLARGLLVLFALILPFETRLFRVGPLEITTVELSLYALLGAWAIALVIAARRGEHGDAAGAGAWARGWPRRHPMAAAAILWCLVLLASALAAPADRGAALKFTLRSASGVLAFFAARDLARPPAVRRAVLGALVAGALISAGTAALDAAAPRSASLAPLWRLFREGSFDAFGLPRPSGVFAYPTRRAMYWEATLPVLIAWPFVAERPGRRAAAWAVLASVLPVGAILASATRSGLAGAAVACVALLWLGRTSTPWVARAAAGVLAVLVASSAIALTAGGPDSRLGQRLRFWHDQSWFGVEYLVATEPRTARVDETFAVPVTLRNTGTVAWPHGGPHPTRLAYHWEPYGRPATQADFEGLRTELPVDVTSGGVVEIVAAVRAPAVEGSYELRWDLVQEQVTWFSEQGNATPAQRVEVGGDAAAPLAGGPAPVRADPPPPARTALWSAAIVLWRAHPLLGVGPDNFRRRYEAVLSPAPTGQPYTDTRMHANSLYLETLADLGLAGAVALALLAAASAGTARRHWAAGELAGIACSVAVGTFFVHGLLDYFLEFTPLFGLFWTLLGLSEASVAERA